MSGVLNAVKPMFNGGDVVGYIAFVVVFIALAFYTTKYISGAYTKGTSSRNIKLIERVNLAADKSLWLIQLGENYYLASSDKKGIHLIDKLSKDDLVLKQVNQESFSKVLQSKLFNKNNED